MLELVGRQNTIFGLFNFCACVAAQSYGCA